MVWRLTHPVAATGTMASASANRETFIQFIEGDETVTNVSNLALVTAAVRPGSSAMVSALVPPSYGCSLPLSCYEFTEALDGFTSASAPLADRDGFLLVPPSAQSAALTVTAQNQVATFVSGGTLQ